MQPLQQGPSRQCQQGWQTELQQQAARFELPTEAERLEEAEAPPDIPALKQRIHEEELAECTFHPVTNEGRNRELIQRILMTEDSFRSDEGGGH